MATEKTPAYKRIQRAETGRDDWKMKALERREEVEKLKRELISKEKLLAEIINRNQELVINLKLSNEKINEQDKLIESLKKNSK